MSDWTSVTSKKKPPSVETEVITTAQSPKETSITTTQTTHIRTEFSVQAGSKKFNPVTAADKVWSELVEVGDVIGKVIVCLKYSYLLY